jgi:hypothetical protein
MTHGIDSKTRKIVEAAVRDHLDGRTVTRIDIHHDIDHEGREWLDIDVRYAESAEPLPVRGELDMGMAINDALKANGDLRIPYVEHYFADRRISKSLERAS